MAPQPPLKDLSRQHALPHWAANNTRPTAFLVLCDNTCVHKQPSPPSAQGTHKGGPAGTAQPTLIQTADCTTLQQKAKCPVSSPHPTQARRLQQCGPLCPLLLRQQARHSKAAGTTPLHLLLAHVDAVAARCHKSTDASKTSRARRIKRRDNTLGQHPGRLTSSMIGMLEARRPNKKLQGDPKKAAIEATTVQKQGNNGQPTHKRRASLPHKQHMCWPSQAGSSNCLHKGRQHSKARAPRVVCTQGLTTTTHSRARLALNRP